VNAVDVLTPLLGFWSGLGVFFVWFFLIGLYAALLVHVFRDRRERGAWYERAGAILLLPTLLAACVTWYAFWYHGSAPHELYGFSVLRLVGYSFACIVGVAAVPIAAVRYWRKRKAEEGLEKGDLVGLFLGATLLLLLFLALQGWLVSRYVEMRHISALNHRMSPVLALLEDGDFAWKEPKRVPPLRKCPSRCWKNHTCLSSTPMGGFPASGATSGRCVPPSRLESCRLLP